VSWLKDLPFAYRGATVLVTGHTGFKGSWLCEWLLMMGARVVGVSLPPPSDPSLFHQLGLAGRVDHHILDIRDLEGLRRLVLAAQPDYLFHLAAQPLVRNSYRMPVETYAVNVMGTVNVLESLRALDEQYAKEGGTCAAVLITTDKVYDNRSWAYGYRENDPLGGYDPYSSSKAAAEIAIASFRSAFFNPSRANLRVGIASARAGNVLGGGDWAEDRIVPDCVRALRKGEAVLVRNPNATRPWQHVLEPLGGYLLLGRRLHAALQLAPGYEHVFGACPELVEGRAGNARIEELQRDSSAFNFGPTLESNRTVRDLAEEVLKHWPGRWQDASDPAAPHEAALLNLATDKAFHIIGWHPRWAFAETVARTIAWYRQAASGGDPAILTRDDISAYIELADWR
jgi:CDP-glucose 4,6-dehydratase